MCSNYVLVKYLLFPIIPLICKIGQKKQHNVCGLLATSSGKSIDCSSTPRTPFRACEQLRQPCRDMLLSKNKPSGNRSDL